MALPALAIGAIAVGAGLGIKGRMDADRAQARSESDNSEFFALQQQQSILGTARALDIFDTEADMEFGDHIGSFARAGIELSGSALTIAANFKAQLEREKAAIVREGKTTSRLAGLRAKQSRRTADYLTSSDRQLTNIGGGIISGVTAGFLGG